MSCLKYLIGIPLLILLYVQNLNCQNKIDSLLNILKSTKSDIETVNIYSGLCKEYGAKNYKKAIEYSRKGVVLSKKIRYYSGGAQCLYCMGNIYYSTGNYPVAKDLFNLSLKIFDNIGDIKNKAECLNSLGNIYLAQSMYLPAIQNYMNSLKLHESMNYQYGISGIYHNMGLIFMYQKNYPLALKYLYESARISVKTGNNKGQAIALLSIGNVFYNQKKYELSLNYSLKALECCDKNDDNFKAYCYSNIGNVYTEEHKLNLASYYYKEAYKIKENENDKEGEAYILNSLAHIYLYEEKYDSATIYALKSMSIAEDLNLLELKRNVSNFLAICYYKERNFKKAFEYQRYEKDLNDSIYSITSGKQIKELEVKYQNQKKEKEISDLLKEKAIKELVIAKQRNIRNIFILGAVFLLIVSVILYWLFKLKSNSNKVLSKINHDLNKSEANLKELNAIKDKFFSLIIHDIRGPLSTLSLILKNYIENSDAFTKEEILEFIKKILGSTDNVSNLFENLLVWSKSEMNIIPFNPCNFCLNEIIDKEIKLYENRISQKQLTIDLSLDKSISCYADINMVSFVMRNLIDNAIKFSHAGGTIRIVVNDFNDNEWQISVIDNGVGISQGNIDKLFNITTNYSTKGTANEKGSGLGLILCNEFINKNNGKIWAQSRIGEGTSFNFTLQKED